ncbi:hypothetical protein [Abditibacterium utsteinense]|uniref:hypothetical protein n=1 Tax=Abditibacterium utsteinense TaxID=1960156 RepID=UPI000CFD2A56|nr:hypothetical protein [Abditibacterium utsteinense]
MNSKQDCGNTKVHTEGTSPHPKWLEGAVYGVEFALRLAEVSSAFVRVVRAIGVEVDTTSTNVAAAAADAVWKAVKFEVPEKVTDKIRQAVLVEWNHMKQGLQKFD